MERMNSETQKDYWEFLPFRLDKANATLWRDNRVVPLRPKSFAALCYLIERRGQLVTKDELLECRMAESLRRRGGAESVH